MEKQIIKHGDFTLTHLVYCDIYSLLYKDSPIWGGNFNELFGNELRDYVFEREPDPKKSEEFIREIYNWGFSQHEAYKKMLDEIYGEEI